MEQRQSSSTQASSCLGRLTRWSAKLVVSVCFGIALLSLVYLALWGIGGFLITGDSVEKADAVVVLSGGGTPRIAYGVKVFREINAKRLIFTETGETAQANGAAISALSVQDAVQHGAPPENIAVVPDASHSTAEEARSVRAYAEQAGLRSVVIVTDPFHTRRVRLIYRQEFSGTDIEVSIKPVAGHWYRGNTWWMTPDGWAETIREYGKLFSLAFGIK
ncbi:MAG TPA: YdcF family protein [Anaerolineaceae bacterium]|nr:YdcF family protein [Anaerolineaceae bacterium]